MTDPAVLALTDAVAAWVQSHPGLAVGLAMGLPFAIGLLLGLVGRRAPTPPAEEPSPPAPAEPEAARLPEAAEIPAVPSPEAAQAPAAAEPAPAPEPALPLEPAPAVEVETPVEPAPAPEEPPVEPAPPLPVAPAVEPAPPPELARPRPLRERLARTSEALVGRLGRLLGGRSVDADILEELEALLFGADLGVATADALLECVRRDASGGDAESVRAVLRSEIEKRLEGVEPHGLPGIELRGSPHVVLVLGVNGSGKTTTIGKLAARHRAAGRSVLLGAGDTFRAAAIEQLQAWGERVGCEVIAGQAGGDPAAVAFDAVKAAVARQADVVLIDTAGRLQTQKPLMEELGKIARVLSRELPDAPHEILLVLDSNTGQNAISQARLFTQAAPVTGLVLTKLDGTAKGGVIVGLADELGIPVKYVGVGEGVEDLRDFSARDFVDALFDEAP